MKLRTTIKSIKLGLSFIKSEPLIFISSLSLITIIAIILWSATFSFYFLNEVLSYVKSKINFSIYFQKDTPRQEILQLQRTLQNLPNVIEVKLITQEEAFEELKQTLKYNDILKQALETTKTNPLSDYLIVTAQNPEVYNDIVSYLEQSKFNQRIEFLTFFENKNLIKKFIFWSKVIKITIVATLIFLLSLITFLLFNLVTLVIFSQKELIEIFRFLGASRFFVRSAFYTMFFSAAVVSCLVAFLIFWITSTNLDKYLHNIISIISFHEFFQGKILIYNLLIFGIIIITTFTATTLSMSKYLKK